MPFEVVKFTIEAISPAKNSPTLTFSKLLMVAFPRLRALIFLSMCSLDLLVAQVEVQSSGIMYWKETGEQVTGFGINYTVPFAHAYRTGKKMGLDLKTAIDQDIYQFSKLGLDLFRVHVWDCEISDSLGNLLDNDHLELFDYLLFQLKVHNIHAVITPIAYWGNGWPEPDEKTPGFSQKYGKDECLVNPEALEAQKRYLAQFVNHQNKFTGIAYKDEPGIIAFEISNEPHHRGTPAEVTAFIRTLKGAIESTGCAKPIFYNVSHSIHLAEAYYEADIAGGTFQWYPTGLGFQKELGGNMLPNVDHYPIPFDPVMKDHWSARIVYEFDAADMASTYMYPAIARSFRSAGMQIATHFAYDPTFLAPYNTEYNTHYMNLMYAPRKALSLMISAEVFRQVPLFSEWGHYPDNTTFGPFRISYEDDLAEMVTEEKFYYTNHTFTQPPSPEKLRHISGWGNSTVVQYDGTGAYFLNRIAPGMWLLEVFPDAIQVDNLFGRNNLETKRVLIHHQERNMSIHLPEFHRGVFVGDLQKGNTRELPNASFEVRPGVFLLTTPEVRLDDRGFIAAWKYLDSLAPDQFYKYVVPSTLTSNYISNTSATEVSAGADIKITCVVATPSPLDSVCLLMYEGWQLKKIRMNHEHGFMYGTMLKGDALVERRIHYYISAYTHQGVFTFPSGQKGVPGNWDYDGSKSYSVLMADPSSKLTLFDATTDTERLNRTWLRDSGVKPGIENGRDFLYIKTERLLRSDPENPDGPRIADYTMRHFFGDLIAGRRGELDMKTEMVFEGYTPGQEKLPLQLTLVMKDGSAFGKIVELSDDRKEYRIKLSDLNRVKAVILPRPYPTFLPYYSEAGKADKLNMTQVESIQISLGPGMKIRETNLPHEVMIGRVWLE